MPKAMQRSDSGRMRSAIRDVARIVVMGGGEGGGGGGWGGGTKVEAVAGSAMSS